MQPKSLWQVICMGFLMFALPVYGQSPTPVQAKDPSKACKEECLEERERVMTAYQECMKRAQGFSDRMSVVKHKKNCRLRHEIPECDHLKPCAPKETLSPAVDGAFLFGKLDLSATETGAAKGVFRGGETVFVRYDLQVGSRKGKENVFEQTLSVVDHTGGSVHEDRSTFVKSSEMTSSYLLKSSFNIPKEFPHGDYRVRISLREKISGWQGSKEASFQVK